MLPTELAIIMECSIIAPPLDYCNALLYGTLSMLLDKLQQNPDLHLLAGVVFAKPLSLHCQSAAQSSTKSPL